VVKHLGFWTGIKEKVTSVLHRGQAKPVVSGGARAAEMPKPQMAVPTGREKITDIKFPTRLTGPLEELANFRLVDFRQLNPDPEKAAMKIREKLDLLENQSFSQRIAGIDAWRRSEVHRLYLALGKESLEQRKALSEVIGERERQKQPFLSQAEFGALGKLNKMLEY